jgi:hypothetical protein
MKTKAFVSLLMAAVLPPVVCASEPDSDSAAVRQAVAARNHDMLRTTVRKACVNGSGRQSNSLNELLLILLSAIDVDFDPQKPPQINVGTPAGTWASSGAAPSAIKDEAKRAEYEAARKANEEHAKRFMFNDEVCRQTKLVFETALGNKNGKAPNISGAAFQQFIDGIENKAHPPNNKAVGVFVKWLEKH